MILRKVVDTEEMPDLPKTITFEYIKTNQFRSICADGAYVAAKANGISITFFSDRQAIPKLIVHELNSNGTLGKELEDKRVVKSSIIRDTEVSVGMSLDAVKQLINVLQGVINQIEKARPNSVTETKQ